MNKLIRRLAMAFVGISMAVGVGVAAGVNAESRAVEAAEGTEHTIESFTGQGEGVLLNNGAVPEDIDIPNPGYPIKQVKISGSHTKSTSITATVSVGGVELASGTIGGSSSWNTTIGTGNVSLNGAVNITFSSSLTGTKKGTITISTLKLVEGVSDSKTGTSLTLTAAGGKTSLDLKETVQLTSVVKDDGDNTIVGAAVTYTSSDTTVATVNSSGLVTASASKYGTTIITASYAGDEDYRACSAKLTIKVANPLIASFVIADIADANSWVSGTAYNSLGTIGNVTISGSGSGNNKKYYESNESWRFYKDGNGAITVSVAGYYYLKSITFVAGGYYFTTAPDANWAYSDKVFTASNRFQKTVTLANGDGTSEIKQIDVEVAFDWCNYFLDTFTCSGVGNGSITVGNPTTVWSDLNAKFTKSDSALKAALKIIAADKDSSNKEAQAMARYDLVIRKYGVGTYADFIGRFSTGGANAAARVGDNSLGLSQVDSATLIIIAISLVGLTAVGGYFVIRRRKENN